MDTLVMSSWLVRYRFAHPTFQDVGWANTIKRKTRFILKRWGCGDFIDVVSKALIGASYWLISF